MARARPFEVICNSIIADPHPVVREPAQWHQAVGVARQVCARIFRDGGNPADAIVAFGLGGSRSRPADWSKAVCLIAQSLCDHHLGRAA